MTLTTEKIRNKVSGLQQGGYVPEFAAAFDQWLAEHDAGVIDAACDHIEGSYGVGFPCRTVGEVTNWFRLRAKQMRKSHRKRPEDTNA